MENRLGNRRIVAVLLALVALMFGGTAVPGETAITDIKSIAGTWKGTFASSKGRSFSVTLTINDAGEYNSERPRGSSSGTLTLKDGKLVTSRGTVYTLHTAEGKRILFTETPDGGRGEYTEVK